MTKWTDQVCQNEDENGMLKVKLNTSYKTVHFRILSTRKH